MTEPGQDFTEESVISDFIPTIAKTWENATSISESEFANRFNHLLETYEVLLKSLAALLYGRLQHYHAHTPKIDRFLRTNFRQPSLGSFRTFIHPCLNALESTGDAWAADLKQGLNAKLSGSAVIDFCQLAEGLQDREWNKQKVTVDQILRTFVEFRNNTRGHGFVREREPNEYVYGTLLDLFRALCPVLEGEWYAVQSVENISDRKQEYEMCRLCGISRKRNRIEDTSGTHLINGRLYAYDPRLTPPWIDLWPLAYWEGKKREVYLYHKSHTKAGKKVQFSNYILGDSIYLEDATAEELFELPSTSALLLKEKDDAGNQRRSLICVTYASADEQGERDQEGWVTTLVKKLSEQLEKKLQCEIGMDDSLNGELRVSPEMLAAIESAPVLLIVSSSNYVMSDWCREEKNDFLKMLRQREKSGGQLVLVERDKCATEDRPPEFQHLAGFRFWTTEADGESVRIFSPSEQVYYDELAKLIATLKEALQPSSPTQKSTETSMSSETAPSAAVFLAEVTDDLYHQRENVKDSLQQHQISVLPESAYSAEFSEFQQLTHDELSRSKLFVQLLSASPEKTLKDWPQSLIRCQYELAKEVGIPIVQWRSPNLDLEHIPEDLREFLLLPTARGDIGLEGLKTEIIQKIQSQSQTSPPPSNEKLVFVNPGLNDGHLMNMIHKVLDQEGLDYIEPYSSQPQSSYRAVLEEWLTDCQALIMTYGQSDVKWFNRMLGNIRKSVWKRAEQPLSAYVVCDPPPEQKPLVKMKIRGLQSLQYGSYADEQGLRSFIHSL